MSDGLYRRVFRNARAGIAVHEPNSGRIERANRAFAEPLGYDPASLEGRPITDLASDGSIDLEAAVEDALDGASTRVETALYGPAGTFGQVTLDLEPIPDETGTRLVSTLHTADHSEHATDRRATERRLQVALAGTNTGVWEWDMATDDVIWTESMEELFGLEPGTFEGTFEAFAERVHPDDIANVQAAIETAVERDESFETEYRIVRDDGERRWVHARGELHDTTDGGGRMVGVLTDVTDRKQDELARRRQEDLYRQLVERLPQAHYTIDDDWRFTFCNQALADRLGRSVEEIIGEPLWEVFPEGEDTVVERTFRRVMETGEPETFDYEYASGDRWVTVQVYPHEDGIAAVSTDVSEQQEALRSILDSTPIILYRFDGDGVFQQMRGEVLSRLGIEPDDLIGENIFEAYADNETVVSAARRALDGESFRYTLTLGDITLETHYEPVFRESEVVGVIGVSMDVTELERQRERMEFFNSILRHDVLNGMTVIKMRAQVLADQLDGQHAEYAQTIVDWCNTTTEVTKRVRRVIETLATPDEDHHLEPIDVSAILTRKVSELETAYPEVEWATDVPDGLRVEADELLADVLGNVLTNSIEHNDTDGLRVRTSVEVEDDAVRILIADDGVGIDDARKESVFRRGATSHAKETGSGFGLFFVDVMVEKYGGSIRVEDGPAGGAMFVIELSKPEARR